MPQDKERQISLSIGLLPDPLPVIRFKGREALNEPFRFEMELLGDEDWADLAIVSTLQRVYDPERDRGVLDGNHLEVRADRAPGEKCARCWRVLEEVGTGPSRAPLCLRCEAAVAA